MREDNLDVSRLESFWHFVAKGVIDQISDLLGARLITGPTMQFQGRWADLRPHLPITVTTLGAQLEGSAEGELGLIWAVSDVGAPDQWLDNDEVRLGLWEAVTSGVANGIGQQTGTQVSLVPQSEPVTSTTVAPVGVQAEQPGVMLTWEATGDGVTLFFAVVATEDTFMQLSVDAPAPQPASLRTQQAAPQPGGSERVQARTPRLPSLQNNSSTRSRDLDIIMDLPLKLTVEIGSARMLIKDVLAMGKGSVVELNKLAGDPVEVLVNGKLLAKGEIVVLPDGNFGVRVVEIINASDRLRNLQAAK